MPQVSAEELLKQGRLDEALAALEAKIRANPADAKLRVFLFQLLCIRGDWPRAITQLNVAAEMNPANLLMSQVCGPALQCEAFRAQVFAGQRSPLVLGEPEEWVGWMIQANALSATGKEAEAAALRERALEAAPAVSGFIDGAPFEWIADADMRLGPVLEAIVEGRYYWVPLSRIARIDIDPPTDLRDIVWLPASLTFTNGGSSVALIPTRYPGSEKSPDAAIRLARKTDWIERDGGLFTGLGQRLFATDSGERPILETRLIGFGAEPPLPLHSDQSAEGEPAEVSDG
jgi:type VI secretion system protein ImpE